MKKLLALLALTVCACGGGGAASSTQSPTSSRPASSSPSGNPKLPNDCGDDSPCAVPAGAYVLGDSALLPGLTVTVPAGGWKTASGGADQGAFDLIPPDRPKDRLFIWQDLVAVKSTGSGHGAALTGVGTTPAAISSWMANNPDLMVVEKPAAGTIGAGITTTALVVGVSPSAQYGDPACTANPRCADLFTNVALWGKGQFFGIAGAEQLRLHLAALTIAGQPRTLFVALDAVGGASDLAALTAETSPIIASLQLPAGATAG